MASAAAKTIRRKAGGALSVAEKLRQFLSLKVQIETLSERQDELKKTLSKTVETNGYQDDKGHFWFDLPEPIEVGGYGTVDRIKYQRDSSTPLDPDEAERILSKKGIWEECSVEIRIPDEEAIDRAYFKKLITKKEMKAMFPEKVHFSFRPQKVK